MKWQLLHNACWVGDAPEVERLLAAGANSNQIAPTPWRQSPLGRTLEFRITQPKHAGHVETVRLLLKAGADPTVRSTQLDMTPYELASFCGLETAADLLRRFKPAAPHPAGMTALWAAAASRLPETQAIAAVRKLLRNSDVNATWRIATPLFMATGHAAHFKLADLLLKAGADPNAGTSILHASCEWHFEHLLRALEYLEQDGWNVNGQDDNKQTSLHKAAFLGYAGAIGKLLKLGADPHAKDASGLTPMDVARGARKPAAIKALS